MSKGEPYQVLVVGGGAAGLAAVDGALKAGVKRIALVEGDKLGGECPHWACVPTKVWLKSARLQQDILSAGRYGIRVKSSSFDLKALKSRWRGVEQALTGNGERIRVDLLKKGVKLFQGWGKFIDQNTLKVDNHYLKFDQVVIATGSIERELDLTMGKKAELIVTRDIFSFPVWPDSVVILGGGPVGLELATAFSGLGAKVTILEEQGVILRKEEPEISALIEAKLRREGVVIITNARALAINYRSTIKQEVVFQVGSKPRRTVFGEKIILSAGRVPRVQKLELTNLGIETKFLRTDDYQRLAHGVWLAGDAAGSYQFTNTAVREGYVAGYNAGQQSLKKRKLLKHDLDLVPRITFIEPELAAVGGSSFALGREGRKITTFAAPVRVLGRALIEGKSVGTVRVVVDAENDSILGAVAWCENAGELIHEISLAIKMGIKWHDFQSIFRAYPTWSEIWGALVRVP